MAWHHFTLLTFLYYGLNEWINCFVLVVGGSCTEKMGKDLVCLCVTGPTVIPHRNSKCTFQMILLCSLSQLCDFVNSQTWTSPFASIAELDMMFSNYDTSRRPPFRAASSSSYVLHNTVCMYVTQGESDTESGIQTNCQTARLLVCFQTCNMLLFCDHTVYLQVWKKVGVHLLLFVCVFCLSMCAVVTFPLPRFPSLSAHLVVAMGTARQRQTLQQPPEGIVRTERRFKGEESLWGFREKPQTFFLFFFFAFGYCSAAEGVFVSKDCSNFFLS